MSFLKRYKVEAIMVGVIVVVLLGLTIATNLNRPTPTPKASVGEVLGQSSNRTAPGANGGGPALTDNQIATYQDNLRARPTDASLYAKLGLAYLQKVREVADPTYYTKAEQVFQKALEIDANNVDAMGGLGSLALSRHQFALGLEWGQKAHQLRPALSYNYGVIADAQIELGRYDQAAQTIQEMVNLRPDLSSYSRVSYLRELNGQSDGAIEAMQEAVSAGGPTSENRAYVTYQLGNLYFNRGDVDKAQTSYQEALTLLPEYMYAQAGLARVAASKGDMAGAIQTFTRLSQRIPLAEFIIELGDLYFANNQPDKASQQYSLVRTIQKLYTDNGVDTDMEMALFDADHDNNLPSALERARRGMQTRPSIKAADVLAWTLYKSGDYGAAQTAMRQALRLNTQDALMFYHAGMIAAKLGQTAEARTWLDKALSLNPNFSLLHVQTARQTLADLGGPVAKK